jgi:hypothetical protein
MFPTVMFPVAYAVSQGQVRRSVVGALATDPVVPECPRRTRLPIRRTPQVNEGAPNA